MTHKGPPGGAIVTGASRGIGRRVALALAGKGFRVAVVARSGKALEELAEEFGAFPITADLRDAEATAAAARQAESELGPIEVLVNNAGTAPSLRFDKTSDDLLDEVLDLHVKAPFRLIRALLPGMQARGSGCIVQMGSTAGLRGFPFTAAYCAAKHGMIGMVRALAAELGDSTINVYAVCPGFVDTDITRGAAAAVAARGKTSAEEAFERMAAMNEIGRMHTPDEVTDVVAWMVRERPAGCVYNMDSQSPGFE